MQIKNKPDRLLQVQPTMALNPINDFDTSFQQIKQRLEYRNASLAGLIQRQTKAEQVLNQSRKKQIIAHCNQYTKLVPLLHDIISKPSHNSQSENQGFWHSNESLERQLEQDLVELKELDLAIDEIVNEQFDRCNEIDEIEETIRLILGRKDAGHIAKAEPYYHQKQACARFLQGKKEQKQKLKEKRFLKIQKILGLLDKLKKHREMGLKLCNRDEGRDYENEQFLMERLIADIKEIHKNESQMMSMEGEFNNFVHFIQNVQKKISDLSKELLNLMDQQNSASIQLMKIKETRCSNQYFQASIYSILGAQNLNKISKKEQLKELANIVLKLQNFGRQNKEKQKQALKIEQGIETTEKTILIFEDILHKIENENSRKKQLLRDIEQIQGKHFRQDQALNSVYENENELDKLKLKKAQMHKNLDNKMNEANLAAYKTIHEEIICLDSEIRSKTRQIERYKDSISENARQLYNETMDLQQSYEDILTEVVPHLLLKGSDFTKEETIKDLNLYLVKVFNRLEIAD